MTSGEQLEVKQEEINAIEFRSEEVREILGAIPHWTIRSGAVYLFALILLAFATGWLVTYPDIIRAPGVITTEVPPASIIAQSSGYLTLWTKDNQQIKQGENLGYIKNTSRTQDVLSLKHEMDTFKIRFYQDPFISRDYHFANMPDLGELQDAYNQFIRALRNYQLTIQQNAALKRARILHEEIKDHQTLTNQQKEQAGIMMNELQLSRQLFERDSILFIEKVISKAEYEQKKKDYLSHTRAYKNSVSGVTSTEIQTDQLYNQLTELTLNDQVQVKDMLLAIEASMNELDKRLRQWEHLYVIKSPIDGRIALFNFWANDQYVKSGDEILAVIPDNDNYFARAKIPLTGAGKIALNQKVNLKLDNYPYEKYGVVTGTVKNISLLPKEKNYSVTIQLDQGLITRYNKNLEFKQELACQAEIITEDLRLIERVFYQFRKLLY